jgi:hypothetical protein
MNRAERRAADRSAPRAFCSRCKRVVPVAVEFCTEIPPCCDTFEVCTRCYWPIADD